mmetsp:Transcript_65727/g.137408  ORF Transcript_65727/g.137408 Transcript_65727/m.137408 type:complete len:229 (-) Transcript_65727:1197-1883(-)
MRTLPHARVEKTAPTSIDRKNGRHCGDSRLRHSSSSSSNPGMARSPIQADMNLSCQSPTLFIMGSMGSQYAGLGGVEALGGVGTVPLLLLMMKASWSKWGSAPGKKKSIVLSRRCSVDSAGLSSRFSSRFSSRIFARVPSSRVWSNSGPFKGPLGGRDVGMTFMVSSNSDSIVVCRRSGVDGTGKSNLGAHSGRRRLRRGGGAKPSNRTSEADSVVLSKLSPARDCPN